MKVQKQIDPATQNLRVLIDYEDGYRSQFELTVEQLENDPFCLAYAIDSAVWDYSSQLREKLRKELNAI